VSFLLARNSIVHNRRFRPGPNTPLRQLSGAKITQLKGNYEQAISWANITRKAIPYQKSACNILVDSYRAVAKEALAKEISRDCLGYFPSRQLHR